MKGLRKCLKEAPEKQRMETGTKVIKYANVTDEIINFLIQNNVFAF